MFLPAAALMNGPAAAAGGVHVFGGTLTAALGSTSPNQQGRTWLGKWPLAAAATVRAIRMRAGASSSGTGQWKGVLYDATGAGGLPGALLAVGAAVNHPAAGAIGVSALASALVLATGDYWIGMVSNDTAGSTGCDSGGGTSGVIRGALLNNSGAAFFTTPVNPAGASPVTYQTLLNFDTTD